MTVDIALQLLLSLLANSQQISALIQQARAEGRETFTPEEWETIVGANDTARKRLEDAISGG